MFVLFLSCMSSRIQRLEKQLWELKSHNDQLEQRVSELENSNTEQHELLSSLSLLKKKIGSSGNTERPPKWQANLDVWAKESPRIVAAISQEDEALLRNKPQEAIQSVRFIRHRHTEGFVDGHRIMSVRTGTVFHRLQFKSGDIILSYNGTPLIDTASLMNAFSNWNSETQHLFLIRRRNEVMVLDVQMNQ